MNLEVGKYHTHGFTNHYMRYVSESDDGSGNFLVTHMFNSENMTIEKLTHVYETKVFDLVAMYANKYTYKLNEEYQIAVRNKSIDSLLTE